MQFWVHNCAAPLPPVIRIANVHAQNTSHTKHYMQYKYMYIVDIHVVYSIPSRDTVLTICFVHCSHAQLLEVHYGWARQCPQTPNRPHPPQRARTPSNHAASADRKLSNAQPFILNAQFCSCLHTRINTIERYYGRRRKQKCISICEYRVCVCVASCGDSLGSYRAPHFVLLRHVRIDYYAVQMGMS